MPEQTKRAGKVWYEVECRPIRKTKAWSYDQHDWRRADSFPHGTLAAAREMLRGLRAEPGAPPKLRFIETGTGKRLQWEYRIVRFTAEIVDEKEN